MLAIPPRGNFKASIATYARHIYNCCWYGLHMPPVASMQLALQNRLLSYGLTGYNILK